MIHIIIYISYCFCFSGLTLIETLASRIPHSWLHYFTSCFFSGTFAFLPHISYLMLASRGLSVRTSVLYFTHSVNDFKHHICADLLHLFLINSLDLFPKYLVSNRHFNITCLNLNFLSSPQNFVVFPSL